MGKQAHVHGDYYSAFPLHGRVCWSSCSPQLTMPRISSPRPFQRSVLSLHNDPHLEHTDESVCPWWPNVVLTSFRTWLFGDPLEIQARIQPGLEPKFLFTPFLNSIPNSPSLQIPGLARIWPRELDSTCLMVEGEKQFPQAILGFQSHILVCSHSTK